MSTVILAEKPSQALAYASALKQSTKKDGYFEIKDPLFTDETFITFGFGHLVEFEELGGKYERQGDYLIPCLTIPAEEEQAIGIWGQRHLDYLKQYRKVTYTNLLTSGRLNAYLADINRQAQERFERLIEGMKQAQGITEQLKAENALEWTGCLNNIRACAREIVEKEIIFA